MTFIIGILGLGFVILIHEFGHFLAAKMFNVEVETFSIGWGPKLFGYKPKETEYCLSLLPLGGYCKMKGETAFRKAIEENDTKYLQEERSLYAQSPYKRILIYLAGPLMNLLLAIIVFSITWFVQFDIRTQSNEIILASDYPFLGASIDSPATVAGIQSGDKIIEIDGKPITNYNDIQDAILPNPNKTLDIKIDRNGTILSFKVTPELNKKQGSGQIGIIAYIPPFIETIATNSPAHIAGLKSGDKIITVNRTAINNHVDFLQVLESTPKQLSMNVLRDSKELNLIVNPNYSDSGVEIGFSFKTELFRSPSLNLFQSIGKGVEETFSTIGLSVKSIALLFQGVDLTEALSGPIKISYIIGASTENSFAYSVREGIINFIRMLGLLSGILFFMNLLPIPALDGGQIMMNIFEAVKGDFLSPKFMFRFQVVGFFFVMILLVFVVFNDVSFLFNR